MSTIGDNPDQDKCGICGTHRALTGSGALYVLAVRGPRNTYVQRICEDCVTLFNTKHWARTRKFLKWMMIGERTRKLHAAIGTSEVVTI